MAQQGVRLDRENFCCSICRDLLKDPVTTSCGHSYCMSCIESFWDGEDEKNIHSCPQCRQTFTPRPVLLKNAMLADLVEELKETELQAAPAEADVLLPEEPKTRADFLRYSCEITLDPNTASKDLLLSEGNRRATRGGREQAYSAHPDRFTSRRQVLSKESLTGRCYWEVERRGRGVCVAVAYKSIGRSGSYEECLFGSNNKSWSFYFDKRTYYLMHNGVQTPVSGPPSPRVGVYLDHSAGILSFYSISKTMTLLHRVQTTFTQPLHAGLLFCYYRGVSAEFCKLK